MRSHSARPLVISVLMLLVLVPWSGSINVDDVARLSTSTTDPEPWSGSETWSQFRNNPTHNSSLPPHSTDGGPGEGSVDEVESLMTIDIPAMNWHHESTSHYGADGYGTTLGDFSASITAPPAAEERCGKGILMAAMVSRQDVGSESHSILKLVDGGSGKVAWEVDLGVTLPVKSAPAMVDIDADGMLELMVAYDTSTSVNLDVYSPRLTCAESGWSSTGHTSELLWTWSDPDLRLGTESPHFALESEHLVSSQLLIADLQMDGGPEAVISVIHENTDRANVVAIPLTSQGPPDPLWTVVLDRGTHVSDPTWVALDSINSAVLLTTIDGNNGNMWVWRVDGETGSLDWERIVLTGTQTDADPVHLRVPGPVIAQLDNDDAPEVVFTIPSDQNGRTNGNGATFVAWELTSTDEIWRFRAPNGYADAAPLPVDSSGDGIHDRICWVTWYSTSTWTLERQGLTGCHNVTDDSPTKVFSRTLDSTSGNDNDEIAASAPLAIDIDGEGAPELLVAFGRRVHAFDGDSGTSADISADWSTPLTIPHRTWSGPAAGDVDGDGALDLLIGDTLVSRASPDASPSSDGRGISFNPEQPDPGQTVTITAQFSNIGTEDFEGPLDAALFLGGLEIGRHRVVDLEATAPTGNGGPVSFSVDVTATRGTHEVSLILDPLGNHSQARMDNDNATRTLEVLDPYVLEIMSPESITRIDPGETGQMIPSITAIGRRTAEWSMGFTTNLPDGWQVSDDTPDGSQSITLVPGEEWNPVLSVQVPEDAEGSQSGTITIGMSLDSDSSIVFNRTIPVEVRRTRGLSLQGPEGLEESWGHGRLGHDATAWILVENLGNAHETTSSLTWDQNSWLTTPRLVDEDGDEVAFFDLEPGEKREFLVKVLVSDQQAQSGETVDNELEICIGDGEETLCRDMDFTFTANGVSQNPPHIRTEPQNQMAWYIEAGKPGGADLQWDLGAAGLLKEGWQWQAEGDLSLMAGVLSTSAGPSPATGWLNLSIPGTTPPGFHRFDVAASEENHSLNISLEIEQVHRSDISLSSEQSEPWMIEVDEDESGEGERLIIRLENPGNGVDTYLISGEVVLDEKFTEDPGVRFLIPNPLRNLSAGAVVHVPVNVSLPDDVPARENMTLRFIMQSTLDSGASDSFELIAQAKPDHRWSILATDNLESAGLPGEVIPYGFNATNIGNSIDHLMIESTISLQHSGGDDKLWNDESTELDSLEIGENGLIWYNVSIPSGAWNGTTGTSSLTFMAEDVEVGSLQVVTNVGRIDGWSFDLTGTELEIPPGGGQVEVVIGNEGNAPAGPWFTSVMPAWNISHPESLPVIDPSGNATLMLNITPPTDGIAGEVSQLRLRARNSDGSGLGEVSIPLRIGANHSFQLGAAQAWSVNSDGGFPLAWVENDGNSLEVLEITVPNLPEGWVIVGDGQVIVAPGEKMGIPLELIPPENWDESGFLCTLEVSGSDSIVKQRDIRVEKSNVTWASSPVLSGFAGDEVRLSFHGAVNSIKLSDSSITMKESEGIWWLSLPTGTGDLTAEVGADTGTVILELTYTGQSHSTRATSCTFNQLHVDTIGEDSHNASAPIATCTIAEGSTNMHVSILLATTTGDIIHSSAVNAPEGEALTTNISTGGWQPEPGNHELTLEVISRSGKSLTTRTTSIQVRATGWNIGLEYIEETSDGGLRIGTSRNNVEVIEGVDCWLTLSSGDWSSTRSVDLVTPEHVPILELSRPPLDGGEKVDVVLSCDAPYDRDDSPGDDSLSIVLDGLSFAEELESGYIWSSAIGIITLGLMWWAGLLLPGTRKETVRKQKTTAFPRSSDSDERNDDTGDIEEVDSGVYLEGDDPEDSSRREPSESSIESKGEETTRLESSEEESQPMVDNDIRSRIKELRRSAREQVAEDSRDDLDRRIDDLFSRRGVE